MTQKQGGIPRSIRDVYEFMRGIENCEVKSSESLPISALLDNPFFTKEDIKANMKFLWEVVETPDLFLWIIQSKLWNRKMWRNHFINKLQHNLSTSVILFFPDDTTFESEVQEYSMTITSMQGTLDYPSVIPQNPDESSLKVWEALQVNALEDILEFESQVSAEKYRLTAEELLRILPNCQTPDAILAVFSKAGHLVQGSYIIPKEDTVLEGAIVHVTMDTTDPKQIMKDYRGLEGIPPNLEAKWIISIQPRLISYYWKTKKLGEIFLEFVPSKSTKDDIDKERIINALTSVIATISRRAVYNADTFAFQYGDLSILYYFAIEHLVKMFQEQKDSRLKVIFNEWRKRFEEVYKEGNTTEELFLKHTYLALLIRLVLYVTYFPEPTRELKSIVEMTSWLEERGFSLFTHDFFAWGLEDLELLEILYYGFRPLYSSDTQEKIKRIFEADDIFRTIYQQMVSSTTRHSLGEFYTPPELARIMVEDAYQYGQLALDPACGSGTFIVEIMRKIRSERTRTIKDQLEALKKIYGFDVNPIAVATSKANVLLQLRDLLEEYNDLRVNIFLCNSLFPMEMTKHDDLLYGHSLEFPLISIDDKVKLNVNFFSKENQESFGNALAQLDVLMAKEVFNLTQFQNAVNNILAQSSYSWMDEPIGSQGKTLKSNFFDIAKKFYELSKNNKNHIWTYLLYNALGTFILSGKADLVIGNPPWIVLNSIQSASYKEKVKKLANSLRIIPESHSVTHLEMSALFLYTAKQFLKAKGRIFFVVSNAFATGENHNSTRQFLEFNEITVWKFTKDVFNIHNICLSVVYQPNFTRSLDQLKKLEIPTKIFEPSLMKSGKTSFLLLKQEIQVPFDVVEREKDTYTVKKLIPKEELANLLPRGSNPYLDICYQGATLVPHNLIFVKIEGESKEYYEISHIIQNPKKPWDFDPIKKLNLDSNKVKIEKEFIFPALKSENVVPFVILQTNSVFLPIEPQKNGGYELTKKFDSLTWQYFQKLNILYKKEQKKGASIQDLWKNINYQNKLTTVRQTKPIKVVLMASGTITKACVVKNSKLIIDKTLYFLGIEDEEEAYFISAFLNAPIVTKAVQQIQAEGAGGKGRHIEKRPFLFAFPKYNPINPLHKKVAGLSKTMEEKAQLIVKNWINNEKSKILNKSKGKITSLSSIPDDEVIARGTIQNKIYNDLGWETKSNNISGLFYELDEMIREIMFTYVNNEEKSDKANKGLLNLMRSDKG